MDPFTGKKETEGKRRGLDPISGFTCSVVGETETGGGWA